jgi:Heterokaryon incompatibility protein (HET)
LVDVGTSDGKIKTYLWIPDETSEVVPYMTISYRWGKSPKVLLTQASISGLCKEVPLNLLPKSNRDAILVTRYIGIRHLWIDALCIIQDLEGDWLVESAKMRDIYKNSYCTVSASQAETGERGCFVNR